MRHGAVAVMLGAALVAALAACRPPPPVASRSDRGPATEAGCDAGARDGAAADRSMLRDLTAGPPYPIVLAHGFFGFDKIGPAEYFYQVKSALAGAGHPVFITTVDPFNSVAVRGGQLVAQVEAILQQTGAGKVNIVGHSQGGLDARWVASRIPARVGAVVTIATPHMGDKVADVLLGDAPGFTVELAQVVCSLVGRPFWGDIADDPDLEAALVSISSAGAAAFNAEFPDVEGVSYFSIGGRSNLQLAEKECFAPKAPPFVSKLADVRDPTDVTLLLTAAILGGSLIDPEPNDGMVNVSSTKWGTWLGCIPADHMDEIGQYFGDSPGPGNSFDYIAFYKELAAFLVASGF